MATSVVTTTINAHNPVGKWQMVIGTLAIAAGDYTTGGLTISFANTEIKSSLPPVTGFIGGKAGYIYSYVPGATKNVGILLIFQSAAASNPMSELPAAATPGAVVADSIYFFGFFPLLR